MELEIDTPAKAGVRSVGLPNANPYIILSDRSLAQAPVKFLRNLPIQTRRDAWVEINLGRLEQNARTLRAVVPTGIEIMAIVKADAYGHGAVMCIPTLEASGVSMVGVAAMDEALQIRQAGLEIPVLVIGVVPDWAAQVAVENDIQLTVFDRHHLDALKQAHDRTGKPVKVHVKVDTGMHRIGIDWQAAADFVNHCRTLSYVQVEGIFSHLSSTEDAAFTQLQLERWCAVLDGLESLPRWRHLANSMGCLQHPQLLDTGVQNMIRAGLALFGYGGYGDERLKPVMGLKARIIHLQDVPPETGISYNHTFTTRQPSRIATLPLGYADGVPRALSNRMNGLIHGHRAPQVGNITMDQMMLDVSAVPGGVRVGEAVTLIGEDAGQAITLRDWTEPAGTIEYELMCGLRVRLPKTYTR